MTEAKAMIEARELRKVFRPPRGPAIEAVAGVSFSVAAGEVFGLLGPNGAGKTTLLRMLATIITPTSGDVLIDGETNESREALRRNIGFLSGNTKLYARLTARETLIFFGRLYGIGDSALQRRSAELSAVLGMDAFMDQRVEGLSTGQTQKVSIARVMMHDPPVLILDEPTLGLDIMTSAAILDFIRDARARGRCIIFSTHYMSEAEQLCDRIGLIHEGRLLAIDTPQAICAEAGVGNLQDAFLARVQSPESV